MKTTIPGTAHSPPSSFTVNGTVEIRSSDPGTAQGTRTIAAGTTNTVARLFQVYNGTLTVSDDFTLQNINSSGSGTMSGHSGATINVEGVTFQNNTSISFGGAIDTYSGVQMVNAKGAIFQNNIGSRGGGVEIYHSLAADFTDATFLNNTATNQPGGAIIIIDNYSTSTPTVVTLGATDTNRSVFSGNRYQSQANSLYIMNDVYSASDTAIRNYEVNIVTAGTGELHLLDPIYLVPGDGSFTFNYKVDFTKTGTGTWFLGGDSQINTGSGRATIDIKQGLLHLNPNTEIHMTGANDSLIIRRGAEVFISGGNEIQGTTVTFEGRTGGHTTASTLTFDMTFYNSMTDPEKQTTPMLLLSGGAGGLNLSGTTINANFGSSIPINGKYLLVRGDRDLDAGQFTLYIDGVDTDVSGNVSDRFGRTLSNEDHADELVLTISDIDNAILRWSPTVSGTPGNNYWSIRDKNWTFPYRTGQREPDSFVTGDTVLFDSDAAGETVRIYSATGDGVVIGAVTDNGYDFYTYHAIGMHVSGAADWTFSGYSISDGYDPDFLANHPTATPAEIAANDARKVGLYYDGSGSLRMQNSEANNYHGNTVHGGTGTIYISQLDDNGKIFHYGTGDFVFDNLNGPATARPGTIEFETNIFDLDGRRFLVNPNGNGRVTVSEGTELGLSNWNILSEGSLAVVDGGKLTFEGVDSENTPWVSLNINSNYAGRGGAVSVVNGGELTVKMATIAGNAAADGDPGSGIIGTDGGAIYADDSTVIIDDVYVVGNRAARNGGVIYANNSNVTLRDSNFEYNLGMAQGGVVYFANSAIGKSLTVEANENKSTTLSNNGTWGASNSIYFDLADNSSTTFQVNVNVDLDALETGEVDMRDPFGGNLVGNAVFNIEKNGDGTWHLGGSNILTGTGTVNLNLNEGTLSLYEDASLDFSVGLSTLTIEGGTTLLVSGGNDIDVSTVTINHTADDNAFLTFDMTDVAESDPALLDLQATTWSTGNWTANVSLVDLNLSRLAEGETKQYALATTNDANMTQAHVAANTVLYYGNDKMSELRENFGVLKVENNTLYVELTAPKLGLTTWNTGSGTWDQTSKNWSGTNAAINDLTGTKQFLNGDAVLFLNPNGSQTITVQKDGVLIANQIPRGGQPTDPATIPGMTVVNSIGNDYTFRGGSIGGTGGFLKQGDGTVTFVNANAFTGSSTLQDGTVVLQHVDGLGTEGGVSMASSATLHFDIASDSGAVNELRDELGDTLRKDSREFTQSVSGDGLVLKTGAGTVVLTEDGSLFSGDVEIRGGTLGIGSIDAIGTATVDTGNDAGSGVFAFVGTTGTFGNDIEGTGALRVTHKTVEIYRTKRHEDGSPVLDDQGRPVMETVTEKIHSDIVLNGSNDYLNGTTVDAGSRLEIDGLAAVGSGNLHVDGMLDMQFDDYQKIENRNITGTGTIEKNRSGNLAFYEATDFSGTYRLVEGTTTLYNAMGLQNATLEYRGGQVDFDSNPVSQFGGLAGGTNLLGDRLELVLKNVDDRPLTLTIGGNHTDQTYDGLLSGSGKLIKTGTGEQILDGVNTYTGGTVVQGGRLVGTDVSSFGTGLVENNAELEFRLDAAKNQTYGNKLTGSGTLIKGGEGSLTLTAENTHTGGTVISGGTLNVSTLKAVAMHTNSTDKNAGTVSIQKDTTFVVSIDEATTGEADTSITRNISGQGTLVKQGAGVLSIDHDIVFTGTIDHQAGTLFINNAINSSVYVASGATLSGMGTVDNSVRFRDGSTHRVDSRFGSGLGIFQAKDIRYDGGSTIYIKVGANGTDQIIARNDLNFAAGGGEVKVFFINLDGTTQSSQTTDSRTSEVFTSQSGQLHLNGKSIADGRGDSKILSLDGVDGQITFTGEGVSILGYEVKKSGQTSRGIFVDYSLGDTFDSYLNQNQVNTLGGIESFDLLDTMFNSTRETRQGLLNQLMPMVQTVAPYLVNRSVTQFNEGAFNRLRFLREPVYAAGLAGNSAQKPSEVYLGNTGQFKSNLWFQQYGDFILMQAKNERPEFRVDSYGFNVGLDRAVHRCSTVGLGMGGYFSDIKLNDFHQKADLGSFLISAYGDWVNDYGWMMTASTGFVFSQLETERNVYAFDTRLDGKRDGSTYFLSLEGSKKCQFGGLEFAPFVGIDFIWLHEKGYAERANGDPSLALTVAKNDANSILSTMGVRLGRTFQMLGGNTVCPTVYAAWVHNYNIGDVYNKAMFSGGQAFSVRGSSMYRDRAKIGTNLDMTLNRRMDMFARLDAELGDHMSDLSVHWGIRLGF